LDILVLVFNSSVTMRFLAEDHGEATKHPLRLPMHIEHPHAVLELVLIGNLVIAAGAAVACQQDLA